MQGGIGINVAQMIVELIRDKRKIVDRITHQQIDEFVGLLQVTQVGVPHLSALTALQASTKHIPSGAVCYTTSHTTCGNIDNASS